MSIELSIGRKLWQRCCKTIISRLELSPRNLWNLKRFCECYYQADTKLLQVVAVLPWGHNLLLLLPKDELQTLLVNEIKASKQQ